MVGVPTTAGAVAFEDNYPFQDGTPVRPKTMGLALACASRPCCIVHAVHGHRLTGYRYCLKQLQLHGQRVAVIERYPERRLHLADCKGEGTGGDHSGKGNHERVGTISHEQHWKRGKSTQSYVNG